MNALCFSLFLYGFAELLRHFDNRIARTFVCNSFVTFQWLSQNTSHTLSIFWSYPIPTYSVLPYTMLPCHHCKTFMHILSWYTCTNVRVSSAAIFYYTLGNISPQYRSSVKCMQLLAITKSSVLQMYGVDCVLENFMKEIKQLEQVRMHKEHIVVL